MATANVSVPSSPVVVFAPSGNDTTAVLLNTGSTTLFLGQSGVTAATGFPLLAGQSISVNYNAKLYAVAGVDTVTSPSTTTTATATVGATSLTVASGTSFTTNMVVSIIDGNNTELVTCTAPGGATTLTVSATAFGHASGVTVAQFSKHTGGSIQVSM